jgi:predicted CoA-binding protein
MNAYESCPLPDRSAACDALRRMLGAKRIAVVGLSDDPGRASYRVADYLQSAGKEIIPVNPNCQIVLGVKCYATLEEIPLPIDVVNVFRRPEFCPDIVRSAIRIGAGGVWLQSGIVSPQSEALAREAGIDFVQNRCLMVELAKGNH